MKQTMTAWFAKLGLLACLLLLVAACGPTTNQSQAAQTVTINKTFQAQLSPVPTVPTYRCGAWSSNNAPGNYSTITIYAKLAKDVEGVSGATATGVVHFSDGDATFDTQPVSDSGGYVSFSLALQGRQPNGKPATVDVGFTVAGQTVQCTPAFFTPM